MEADAELIAIKREIAALEARLQGKIPGAALQIGKLRQSHLARIHLYDVLDICDIEGPEPPPKPEPSEPDSGEEVAQLRQRIEAHGQQLNGIEEQLRQITARLDQQGK